MGMQLCFLISRLALWAHNLISQLTLYDTPRATEISASPPSKKMQSNSIQVENETEPILIRSVCKQSYKLSSALVEATTPREPRIENREWRIELKKTFQTSFSSHLQLERAAGGGRRKRLKNQLTIHLKAANAFERYFFPTLR